MSRTAKRRSPGALGTVRQLPSGRFKAFYRHAGETFSAPHTFDSRDAARGWLAAERADRVQGRWRDPRLGAVTLDDYARGWLDSRTTLAPRTRDLYRGLLHRRILPTVGALEVGRLTLGAVALAALTPALVRTWFTRMSADCARDAAEGPEPAWRPGSTHGQHPARAWALAEGRTTATRGRLSAQLLADWRSAGSPGATGRQRRRRGTGRTVAAQAYRLLHAVLATAVAEGLIPANPAMLKGAGTVHHAERETANPDEVAQLAALMPAKYAAAVWLAAWSGLRRGELLGLARRHVDLVAGSVRVERALGRGQRLGPTKTRSAVRTVYLPRFVVDQLARHLDRFAGLEPDSLLFTSAAGTPAHADYLLKCFTRARDAIGRPRLTWHDLRHTGATLAYGAGGSVREVQRRLGHATPRAAMIYAHAADDSDRHLAARLDATYRPRPTPDPSRPDAPDMSPQPAPDASRPAAGDGSAVHLAGATAPTPDPVAARRRGHLYLVPTDGRNAS